MSTVTTTRPAGKPAPAKRRRRWPWLLAAVVTAGAAYYAYGWFREEQQVAVVKAKQEELRKSFGDGPPDPAKFLASREKFEEIRKEAAKLPEARQQTLREEGFKFFQQMMVKRIKDYDALPKGPKGQFSKEQLAHLNADIDRMESMRKMFQQQQQQQAAGKGGTPGGSGGPPAGGPPGGPGGPPPGGPPRDAQSAQDRGKTRLDRMSPEMRADMSRYFADINQARKLRGLPPFQPGPPGRPGGGPPR